MGAASNRARGSGRGGRNGESDASVRQALERAVEHAQLALSEGVASARALLDAASIGVSGGPAKDHAKLSELAWALDRISAALSGEAPTLRAAALNSLLAAVDREVARWEIRSRSDQDARAVLRAFLGLREILWEMGVRPGEAKPGTGDSKRDGHGRAKYATGKRSKPTPPDTSRPKPARVQRIKIRG